ncbi:MAG: hypothetical protein ACE3L7_30675 [Candidatus Pristimantibacillus sp.]
MKDFSEDDMESKWKTALWIVMYAIACGALLAIFSLVTSMVKFLFSLLALYLIIRFFKRYETWGVRIVFIISTLIIYFGVALIATAIKFMNDNALNPAGL